MDMVQNDPDLPKTLYDPSCLTPRWLQLLWFMSQALATGVSTGTSLAVLWKVFEGLNPGQPVLSLCAARSWWEPHWPSVVLGLLLGLLLGPILEALICLRIYLHQVAIRRFLHPTSTSTSSTRPLHRLAWGAWMDARITSLEVLLDDVRAELRDLRVEVGRVRRLVLGDRGVVAEDADSRSEVSDRSSRASEGSFSLVAPSVRSFNENASRSRSGSGDASGSVREGTDPERVGSTRSNHSWLEREQVCDEIAEFIKRCLGGDHRGSSGRDRIALPSKIWLVFRDFEGIEYRPVRVCRNWSSCKELVKKNGAVGDSVFVGLPSEREACRVASQAGVGWPIGR